MAFVFDHFWDPKKKKYGIYAISYHYEVPKEKFFKNRKDAIKEVRKMRRVSKVLANWQATPNPNVKRPPGVGKLNPKDLRKNAKKR